MKRIALLIMVALMASMVSLSAKKSESKPEGQRIVLSAARDFNAIVLNAPVTVELIEDAQHPGFVVYHSTLAGGELNIYNKGSELRIDVKNEFKNKKLHVTSRVVICHVGNICSAVVNGSGTVLSKKLNVKGDMKCAVNGSGDIKIGEMIASGSFDGAVNGSGDLDINTLEASSVIGKVNGSGDLDIKSCTLSGSAVVAVNGSGDLDIDAIEAVNVTASLNGSGDINVKGKASEAALSLSGSGDLDAGSLDAGSVSVTGSGSGDIYCRASRSLAVNARKSCDVHVCGSRPANVNINSDNVHFEK